MISLEKIAELAGVSRRTVARALKDKSLVKAQTLEKIEAVLKENNYTPNLAARCLAVKSKSYRILFMILKAKNSAFHAFLYEKAKIKARELEGFGLKVDFLLVDRDLHHESLDISNLLEDFPYDFLITLPVYEDYFKPFFVSLVKKAQDKGVPIIFYNMDDKAYPRLCYVGCDYFKAGRIGAGLIALATQNKGNVAIISNRTSSLISFSERIKGFKFELKEKYPKLKIVYEHAMEHNELDINLELLKDKKVSAVYLVNPGDYSAVEILASKLPKLKIITNDKLPISENLLKEGKISALIEQEAQKQVTLPLDLAFEYLVNHKKPEKDSFFTELSILIGQCV